MGEACKAAKTRGRGDGRWWLPAVHLLGEAEDRVALVRGMKGLGVRVARRRNPVMGRRGRVPGDRYQAHILRTPSEVRRARSYLTTNARRHYGLAFPDPFTSVAPIVQPRTYLLRAFGSEMHLADNFGTRSSGPSSPSRGSRASPPTAQGPPGRPPD